ncbi:MAG: cob(I)yrinic acid a,c-diamide adenosyltransferase [Schleiferiaceae bacterium]|jgi:cob(I)alamin adenosyltransferase|nr:cob(I)yrinic acid a,c-diamide adenosyltransferase [Schleiferiaceae bacterium]
MKIYTKTGDKGTTSLVGGSRVSKYDVRLHAYGSTDELNSWIGLIGDLCAEEELKNFLRNIQVELFDLGSNLASEKGQDRIPLPKVEDSSIKALEQKIDEMNKILPQLRTFILPGGDVLVSYCHIARTVCRRAERWSVELIEKEELDEVFVKYLNRMSDFLFVLARYFAHSKQVEEIPWIPRK